MFSAIGAGLIYDDVPAVLTWRDAARWQTVTGRAVSVGSVGGSRRFYLENTPVVVEYQVAGRTYRKEMRLRGDYPQSAQGQPIGLIFNPDDHGQVARSREAILDGPTGHDYRARWLMAAVMVLAGLAVVARRAVEWRAWRRRGAQLPNSGAP